MRWPRLFLLLGNPDDHTVLAGSLFSVAGGVWVFFGNAGIPARENFERETAQYRVPVGPDTVAKR